MTLRTVVNAINILSSSLTVVNSKLECLFQASLILRRKAEAYPSGTSFSAPLNEYAVVLTCKH